MLITEDIEERIGLIADGCKVSQESAQLMYEQSQHLATDHYETKIMRIKELATLQKMGKRKVISGKTLAAGE